MGRAVYPILDDVIILCGPDQYSDGARARLGRAPGGATGTVSYAEDIQFTFGEEWKRYGRILPEHAAEFQRYFDLVDPASLRGARVCDLGCGIGRWSHFLKDACRELVLVDFSDAIFAARRNLSDARNALFFMGDLTRLPFKDDFCDFLFCLGVLHHLPVDCLDEVRRLKGRAPRMLFFLYYALDNRPFYFRWILAAVTVLRRILCRLRSPLFRKAFSRTGALLFYAPLVLLGRLLRPLGMGRFVPLYEFYHDKSLGRIEQDVYDRFFTRIEQRVSRDQIRGLSDSFRRVVISDDLPYWHFLCER